MTKRLIIPFMLGVTVAVVFYEATGLRLFEGRGGAGASGASASPVASKDSSCPPAKLASTGAPGPRPHAEDSDQAAKLQSELSNAQTRASFAERQLEALEGQPIPWPDDVAPSFKKEAVEQQLKQFIVDKGLAKVKNIDCTEYPCVEVLQVTDTGPEGMKSLHTALSDMVKQSYNSRVVLSIQNTRTENGSNVASYAGVSVVPNEDDAKSRSRHRAKLDLDEYGQ